MRVGDVGFAFALGLVACGGSGAGDGGGAGTDTDPTATHSAGTLDGSGATTDSTSAGPGGTFDDGTDSASDDGSSGSSGEPDDNTLQVVVVPSTRAVLEADDGGALTVTCHVMRGGEPVIDAAPTISISPSTGVDKSGGTYTFAEFGVHDATCEVDVEGETLSATTSIAVLNEVIDPSMARMGEGLGASMTGLFAVMAAHEQPDQALVDAIDTLDAALPHLQAETYAELTDVLRPVPGDYYPTTAELEGLGIAANTDDGMLPAALDDLQTAVLALQTTVAAFDPDAPTDADAEALAEHTAELEAAVDALRALQPTAHGLLATRERVADLVRDGIAPGTQQLVTWADARIRSEADSLFDSADPGVLHFGLLGLTIGMFGNSYLQVQLINEWYGDYIAQLDESFNNFILAGAIDYFIPLGDNPPTIEYLVASASAGFATPGYPTWVDGYNFHEDPQMNLFLVFGDSWQGIIDAIISACGVEEADTIPEKVDKVVTCLQEVQAAAESILVTPLSVGDGLYGSQQGLDLGEFPEVCSGGLPTATFLLPINYVNGRGPTYFVNCI